MHTHNLPDDIDELWDYNDPAASERRFCGLLARAEPAGEEYRAQVLTQVARAQGLQRAFAVAHATLDQAEALLAPGMAVARIRTLIERGRVYNTAGAPAQARPLFLAALEQARAAGEDFYAVDAAHMLGIIGTPAEQLHWNRQALALAEQSSQPRARGWLGPLYNNMGWSYHDLGQHEQALQLFEQALAVRVAAGAPGPLLIARWCVGRALRALGRYREALAAQRALAEAHAQAGTADGYVFEELAENLLALGQAEAAWPYFAQAYAELVRDPWLAEREPARLARLRQLGAAPAE